MLSWFMLILCPSSSQNCKVFLPGFPRCVHKKDGQPKRYCLHPQAAISTGGKKDDESNISVSCCQWEDSRKSSKSTLMNASMRLKASETAKHCITVWNHQAGI